MKPIETKNTNIVYGEGQDAYQPLPAWRNSDGQVVTCWELTDEEVQQVIESRRVFLVQLTFNQPLQPCSLHTDNPVLQFVPHIQTRFSDGEQTGNCFATAIACIIGAKSPEDVFQVQEHYKKDDWELLLKDWLLKERWLITDIDGHLSGDEIYMVIGESPRHENRTHVCLYMNGKMVHDPHPDGTGIKSTLQFKKLIKRS